MSDRTKGLNRPGEVLTGNTTFYTAVTLVDITDSGNSDPKNSTPSFRQAQNLNTLIQVLSLRTQLVLSSVDTITADLSDYDFGTNYSGEHAIWIFKFACETLDVYTKGNDNLYFAKDDADNVPIHLGLSETVDMPAMFNSKSTAEKNIYFTFSESL